MAATLHAAYKLLIPKTNSSSAPVDLLFSYPYLDYSHVSPTFEVL